MYPRKDISRFVSKTKLVRLQLFNCPFGSQEELVNPPSPAFASSQDRSSLGRIIPGLREEHHGGPDGSQEDE